MTPTTTRRSHPALRRAGQIGGSAAEPECTE